MHRLGLASTNVYVSTTPMVDALRANTVHVYLPNEGNQSVIKQTPGVPVWIGFVRRRRRKPVQRPLWSRCSNGELNDNDAPDPVAVQRSTMRPTTKAAD